MGQWNELCQTGLAHFTFTFPVKDFKVIMQIQTWLNTNM